MSVIIFIFLHKESQILHKLRRFWLRDVRIERGHKGHVLLGQRGWQVSGESVVWVSVGVCAEEEVGSYISHSKEIHKTGEKPCGNSKLGEAGQKQRPVVPALRVMWIALKGPAALHSFHRLLIPMGCRTRVGKACSLLLLVNTTSGGKHFWVLARRDLN